MKGISLFKVELLRILRSKSTWLVMILSSLTPIIGYYFYTPAVSLTKASIYIANPILSGALGGAILIALLTLFELDRVFKNETAALTDTIASPLTMNICRMLALMVVALLITLFTSIIYLPYTMIKMGMYFLPGLYVSSFLSIMLFNMLLAILIAATFYQLFQRVDVSFVLFIAFILFSLSQYVADDYILRWANPLVPIFSDDFSNSRVIHMVLYNRLCWLLILSGTWLISLLCVRRYGKGLIRSFLHNGRKVLAPLLALCLIFCGGAAYAYQPFIDHSPIEAVFAPYEYNENVLMEAITADVKVNAKLGTLMGAIRYAIKNEQDTAQDCTLNINPGYKVRSATLNGEKIPFVDLQNDVDNAKEVILTIPANAEGDLIIEYGGLPQEWSLTREMLMGDEIGEKYISLSRRSFLPTLLVANAGTSLTCNLTVPGNLSLVVSGKSPVLISENNDGSKTWKLEGTKYAQNFTLYAADYVLERFEEAGMVIEFYYSLNHQVVMDKLEAMDMIRKVLNYCAEKYGPLKFDESYPLKLVQETAYALGGGAFSNFSVMGESTFSEENLDDPGKGANGSEVLAHEIIHQWWGLTWMMWDEDEWTSEGVTCYTTYRLMKELYGDEYAKKYYVDVWQAEVDNLNESFYHRHPEYLDILPEKYAANIRSAEWGTNMYSVMPLKFLKAAELLGGEDELDKVLAELFQNTDSENYPYITYDEFLSACNLTREDLTLD